MNESDIRLIVESTSHYFREITNEKIYTGIPFLTDENPEVLEYTAIINISGEKSGSIYITAMETMIDEFYTLLFGNRPHSPEEIKDMVGEIANTISGNLRQTYGKEFEISVPLVVNKKAEVTSLIERPPSFIFPFTWRLHKAFVVACLN